MTQDLLTQTLGWNGRMISGSKSFYIKTHPKNFVIFNANVCTESTKIWYGDLDLTLDKEKLSELAVKMNENLYVFFEMDARFDKEDKFVADDAAVVFTQDGKAITNKRYAEYYGNL